MTFDEKNSLEIIEKAKSEALNMITNTWKHVKEKDSDKVEGLNTEVRTLQQSLDRHLEIYANNGTALKELTKVVDKVDGKIEVYHSEAREIAKELEKKVNKIMEDVAPLVELSRNASGASKFINWIFSQWKWFAVIVVIGWLAIVTILKQLN